MARGDVRQAESLLELAAQRGRDVSTLLRLATVRRALGDYPGAVTAAGAGVELAPRNFLMCLLLGSLRETMGAPHAAARAYRAAIANVPLDLSFQPGIHIQLERAKRWVEALDRWREGLLEWAPKTDGLRSDEQRRMRGLRGNILENLDAGPLTAPAFLIPGIRPKTYFDATEFGGVAEMERNLDVVRQEFLALAADKAELSHRLKGLHSSEAAHHRIGTWSMIPLIRAGSVVEEFASKCPRTVELANALDLPALPMISPSVYFSVLEPGSRIAPHTGLTNARAIAHFPLIVPENCGFRVGGETRAWVPGKALIFDDMTVHEAWNDSDRIRVVLIADLWRPELSTEERAVVTELMGFSGLDLQLG
jgi:aspartyl/asparaginyl beta-hydroxylase (cupin superfamily)